MVGQQVMRVAVVFVALVVAACAHGPSQSPAEAACAGRGLTPGTAEFYACLHPSEATTLREGEAAWQQMDEVEE